MRTITFFDTKPYDRVYFDQLAEKYGFAINYVEEKLTRYTAALEGVKAIAMRCSGYNNVDFQAAYGKLHVMRVPAYSPYAVAEYTMGMLLMLNRKLHRAYNRTREFNFSLVGLTGFDLYGKTVGVVGTGKIGQVFINICKGFGMRVLAYDPYPVEHADFSYVSLEELCRESDVISLHCPLTKETFHIIDKNSIAWMKEGVYLLNTVVR